MRWEAALDATNASAFCGTTEQLEFDCIKPMGDKHHRYDTSQRMSFYRRRHAEGNLQVLCSTCNARKGASECYPVPCDGDENNPFKTRMTRIDTNQR